MKNVLIIIALLSLCSFELFSQENKSLEFHIAPLSLNDYNPRLRCGIEYNAGKQTAFSLDFGFGNKRINKTRVEDLGLESNYQLYELRPEIKYHFYRHKNHSLYIASELFFIKMHTNLSDSYYFQKKTSTEIHYDKALYNKEKYGLHIKGGFKVLLFDIIKVDAFAGFGFAHKTISYSNVIIKEEDNHFLDNGWWGDNSKNEGDKQMLHLSLGVKIGFVLWKNKM